jgi:hypothetical protein
MSSHHGSTPAAWTGVSLGLLAFLVGGIGLLIESMPVFYVGVALAVIAVVAAGVMARMGMGAEPR